MGKDAIVIEDGQQITSFKEGILPWTLQHPTALNPGDRNAPAKARGRPDAWTAPRRNPGCVKNWLNCKRWPDLKNASEASPQTGEGCAVGDGLVPSRAIRTTPTVANSGDHNAPAGARGRPYGTLLTWEMLKNATSASREYASRPRAVRSTFRETWFKCADGRSSRTLARRRGHDRVLHVLLDGTKPGVEADHGGSDRGRVDFD